MKYYKVVSNNFCFYLKGKIYPENYKQSEYCNNIGLHAKHCPSVFKEVSAGEYFVQEGKMPEYFVIKRVAGNPLWQKYIDWLSNTYFNNLMGCIDEYYGFDNRVSIHAKLKYFKNNPVKLILEQWNQIVNKTMEEEFKLPKKWCVLSQGKDTYKKYLQPYLEKYGYGNPEWNGIDYYYSYVKGKFYADNCPETRGCVEITFEQFIKHVLNQEVMEDKEIIGWKLKEDCEQYKSAALKLVNSSRFYSFAEGYNFAINSENESSLKKAGVLELWFEPVYKEKIIKFGGYNVTFEKVTSGVRITCNGETGTFSQVEAIYNFYKGDSAPCKFGSQVVKEVNYPSASWELDFESEEPTSIKIGCTTGTWKEFVAIYEKAKSML